MNNQSIKWTLNASDWLAIRQLIKVSVLTGMIMYFTNVIANFGILPSVFTWGRLLTAFSITPMFAVSVLTIILVNVVNVLHKYTDGPSA